jgi:DNA-binding PadR family transcriptional regulator
MTRWLQSGRRRDLCIVLAGEGPLNGQALKSRLESHYGARIEPKSFYGALDTLVDNGHLELRESGIHDEYALTDAGRQMVDEQFAWMRDHVEADDTDAADDAATADDASTEEQ